jgi:Zn-dependent alcohol dehydrogenase
VIERGSTVVRAAVLRAMGAPPPYAESRPLRVEELELAPPGAGEIQVRVRAAGLCHSDLSVINGSRPRVMPMALGHEAAGEVVALGEGVDRFALGDHVVLAFVPVCGGCRPCLSGRGALCEPGAAANAAGTLLSGEVRWHDATGDGVYHHLGISAFAEQIVVSDRSAVKIDSNLAFETAALFGCAVLTGAGAVMNALDIQAGDSVAVFGLGGVGLAAVMAAVAAGAEVIAVDRVADKLKLARELGAQHALSADPGLVETIRKLTGGGADHVAETVGSAAVLEQAYAATHRGGTTVTMGLPDPQEMLSIPAVSLVAEERTLKGSYLGSSVPERDIPKLIAQFRAGQLPVEKLLTHRLGLEELNEGFDRLARAEAVRQVLVL